MNSHSQRVRTFTGFTSSHPPSSVPRLPDREDHLGHGHPWDTGQLSPTRRQSRASNPFPDGPAHRRAASVPSLTPRMCGGHRGTHFLPVQSIQSHLCANQRLYQDDSFMSQSTLPVRVVGGAALEYPEGSTSLPDQTCVCLGGGGREAGFIPRLQGQAWEGRACYIPPGRHGSRFLIL